MRELGRRSWLFGVGGATLLGAVGCSPTVGAAGRVVVATEPRGEVLRGDPGRAPEPAAAEPAPPEADEPPRGAPAPSLDLPERTADAETGSAFLARTEGLGRGAMDEAVVEAILGGNVPSFLRRLVPIEMLDDAGHAARLHVTCDYLAIGSDEDFVRIPMTSAAGQRLADRLGATLPTPKLVDAIYEQAQVKLPPSWIDGGPTEGTLADYALHHERLEEHRLRGGHPLGALTAGHKKDIVLCDRLAERPSRVAIYGWHKPDGRVVQPLSTTHSCRYADYSHGVRLVDQRVEVDGAWRRVSEVLRDPQLAWLLSDEGPLETTAYPRTLPPYEGPRASKKRKPKRATRG